MSDANGVIDGPGAEPADTGTGDAEATRVVPSRARGAAGAVPADTGETRVVPSRVRRDTTETGPETEETRVVPSRGRGAAADAAGPGTDAGTDAHSSTATGTDAEATRVVPSRGRGADLIQDSAAPDSPAPDGPAPDGRAAEPDRPAPGAASGAQTRSRSSERSRSASASRRGILERAVGTTGPGPGPVPEPEIALPAGLGSPTVPRAYGARQIPVGGAERPDAVQQRLGAAPEPGDAGPGPVREGLPSVLKRSARDRTVTLVAYGAVIVVSAAGLWAISRVVWG